MSRQNRNYNKEFKLNAVQLCKNSEKSVAKIASDLGVPKQTLYQWAKDYQIDGFRVKETFVQAMRKFSFLKKS